MNLLPVLLLAASARAAGPACSENPGLDAYRPHLKVSALPRTGLPSLEIVFTFDRCTPTVSGTGESATRVYRSDVGGYALVIETPTGSEAASVRLIQTYDAGGTAVTAAASDLGRLPVKALLETTSHLGSVSVKDLQSPAGGAFTGVAWIKPAGREVELAASAAPLADSAAKALASREIPALAELKAAVETRAPGAAAPAGEKKVPAWALMFRFGPTFTDYAKADLKVDTARFKGTIHDATIHERNDMGWYRLANMKARPLHFIDEPSNDFTFGLENRKKGYAVNFTARHPKFMVAEERTINQDVRVEGTLDGQPVDERMAVDDVFAHWRVTHRLMNYQLQAEKLFSKETPAGRFTFAPGVAAGIYQGLAIAAPVREDGRIIQERGENGIIGKSFGASVRASYEIKRISANLAYQWTKGALDYALLDGRANHSFDNKALTFQLGVTLFKK